MSVDVPECVSDLFRSRERKTKAKTKPKNGMQTVDSTHPTLNEEVPFTVIMVGSVVRGKHNVKAKLRMLTDALHMHPIFGMLTEASSDDLDNFIR